MYDSGGMLFGGGVMWIFWLLLVAAIIIIIKVAISGDERNDNHAEASPFEILKKRYARGEIDDEEFTRWRRELKD